ncbi:antitoxin Xre/MbcA/ParS toxin-binding domain-containing protein [Dongia sedimenti]|uniref:antitoxin Xre/MbcA/ParS toxin-binding domain-containing protein n=1 Tax=Dongia sedimenti TaxID=3064282 RepID=UPI0036D39F70
MGSENQTSLKERRASIQARAAALQGSEAAGKKWLTAPAIGLNGEVPADLLRSQQGAERVEELLMRLEYGVYS